VSNLVFHEVKDTEDKRLVVKEALRVVKKGGDFAFQDLFHEEKIYGDIDDLSMRLKTGEWKKFISQTPETPNSYQML